MKTKNLSKELVSLIKLISFFKQLRHKDTLEKASFFFVNDLYNIISYQQCIAWQYERQKIKVIAASGQTNIADQGPFAQSLKAVIQHVIDGKNFKGEESLDRDIDDDSYAEIYYFTPEIIKKLPSHLKNSVTPNTICVFLYDHEKLIGGIWLDRDRAAGDMEKAVLEDVADAFAGRLQFFQKSDKSWKKSILHSSKGRKAITLALLFFCLLPVRFSVTASAEIVAEDLNVVSVKYGALVADVVVKPNQMVKKGDVLFTLDKTQLDNDLAVAKQELASAIEKLAKTERESFIDENKRYEINLLRELVKSKRLEVQYAERRLEQSFVTATKDGVVLFSDVSDLMGQPVRAGDQVMVIADPDKIELLVRIPTEGMVNIRYDVPVKFFLNTDPLKSHKALISNISYQPMQSPDGTLNYNARARIVDQKAIKRIGLTGTAKVYGDRTLMIFNILRRPMMALRNILTF